MIKNLIFENLPKAPMKKCISYKVGVCHGDVMATPLGACYVATARSKLAFEVARVGDTPLSRSENITDHRPHIKSVDVCTQIRDQIESMLMFGRKRVVPCPTITEHFLEMGFHHNKDLPQSRTKITL